MPQEVEEAIWKFVAAAERTWGKDVVRAVLLIHVFLGNISVIGINQKGRFVYADANSANARLSSLPESVARAHQVHVIQIIRAQLMRTRRVDEISIVLLCLGWT